MILESNIHNCYEVIKVVAKVYLYKIFFVHLAKIIYIDNCGLVGEFNFKVIRDIDCDQYEHLFS